MISTLRSYHKHSSIFLTTILEYNPVITTEMEIRHGWGASAGSNKNCHSCPSSPEHIAHSSSSLKTASLGPT